jgi:hypothetical protein
MGLLANATAYPEFYCIPRADVDAHQTAVAELIEAAEWAADNQDTSGSDVERRVRAAIANLGGK